MFKSFLQAQQHLNGLIPITSGRKFPGARGVARMIDLLDRLGNPHHRFPSIHVVGTAGKGSTAYLAAKIVQQAGYQVGLHTSPHLQTMRERMIINEKIITEKDFIAVIDQIKPIAQQMAKTQSGRPSYFETLLAASFLYFAQKDVDLAIIEAGLGGRYDGTNVLNPTIAILTNIGLDHTRILGKTKTLILKDKMQIIKLSCKYAITAINQKNLLPILKKHCFEQKVPLLMYQRDFKSTHSHFNQTYSEFNYILNDKTIEKIKISLSGIHQVANASLAITACLKLAETSRFKITDEDIKKALSQAFFPGRMETINQKPKIILDGAHNDDKIKALVTSIKKIYPCQKMTTVFALKKDKNAANILSLLKTITQQIIITQFNQFTDMGHELYYPAEKLMLVAKKTVSAKTNLILEKNSASAFDLGVKLAKKQKTPLLITGSLYLVGEARQFFKLLPFYGRRRLGGNVINHP